MGNIRFTQQPSPTTLAETIMPRKIRKDAIKLLDARIKTHTLAQACIESKNARQLFVEVVKACVGIKEIPSNEGVEVELFQKTVSHQH